ncbi:hypothetical protein H072_6662 [Dactylellina haptotyla CBS 200.50]|uniref:Copper acquisition factor BIM1-like domain-containing protein n=1 Tax=Dactylellina haptotyla (strain CBS 200.50) TaxID=1284197 RepID=S8BJK3_DACHA|nr:hypothetical protein H072_6662 [Dactylellina haptotyla CBS 200.50]
MLPSLFLAAAALASTASAHFVITYPADRGNSYNTQFQFPCGGLSNNGNRSAWPTNGGAIAFVPLHDFAFTTINIAIGNSVQETTDVNRYNHIMVATFNQTGGNGTFCLPTVKIPGSLKPLVKAGVNATIQVVQLVASGSALYNCADITFSDTEAQRFGNPQIWNSICFNSTNMGANRLSNAETAVNYTELALQELNLKTAAGAQVSLTSTTLFFSLAASIAVLLSEMW